MIDRLTGGDIINFIIACLVFLAIGYFVSYWMSGKFNYATPGRNGNYSNDEEEDVKERKTGDGNSQPERIIALLGGRDTITLVDACMTRLRVTVKDPEKVADVTEWKKEGAMGLMKKTMAFKPSMDQKPMFLNRTSTTFCRPHASSYLKYTLA